MKLELGHMIYILQERVGHRIYGVIDSINGRVDYLTQENITT